MNSERSGWLPSAWVAREQVSYDEVRAANGALWWLQSDPDLGGARRLMRAGITGVAESQTPPDASVGGYLHAYGGGSYAVADSAVWFVRAEDSKIYRIEAGNGPELVVSSDDGYAYGDLWFSPAESLLAVRGDEAGDEIVEVSHGGLRVLVRSTGFLAAPRQRGGLLAYLEWGRDEMPWDASRLRLAELGPRRAGTNRIVAGGEHESVVQPHWGPEGHLYFLSDRNGWWNLYRYADNQVEAVAPLDADCAAAPWEGGYQSYVITASGEVVLTANDGIRTDLVAVGRDGQRRRCAANLSSVKPYLGVLGNSVAVIGSTPVSRPSVYLIDLALDAGRSAHPISPAEDRAPEWGVSPPTEQAVKSAEWDVRYLLHRPHDRGPVPLIVRAHPGPTDDVPLRLDWTIQFFVSRGYAVAEVAYRGSTGQGRAFRQSLHGHWGEYDVDDCALVAEQLVADGVGAPGAVFISGASAGGYTALQAACRPGPFTGATATSAIIDPARWRESVPAFQRPHAAILAGPAGAVQAGAVEAPLLLIHGTADEISSAGDAMQLADDLAALDHDHEVLLLDDGDHYLSAPEHLEQALRVELAFYERLIRSAAC
ncbi:prolyl oligopeptidase family serine peptidase [Kitasatospora sp. NPDC050463]|uniref:alpha/beta hydrolase family protein n=1 Tax=Kitasatospora sp. NPDC050463 TaxID=3155786 RepID=UPI0033EF5306